MSATLPFPANVAIEPRTRRPRLAFGPFIADPETGRLTEGHRLVPLTTQPFETLCYLAHSGGRVVSKAELMREVWRGTSVTENVLAQSIVDIRRALGDTAKSSQYVQNLPRRGYRFAAPVRLVAENEVEPPFLPARPARVRRIAVLVAVLMALVTAGAVGLAVQRSARRNEAMPPIASGGTDPGSVLVMPILIRGVETEKGWLRNGVAELIGTQLGQTRGLHVVPRHQLEAALAADSRNEDDAAPGERVAALARRVRAEWLVTAAYVRLGDRFLLTAQVVEVSTSRTVATALERGRHPGDLLTAVDALCLKLLPPLQGTPEAADDSSWHPRGLATRSIEASRHYVEALDVWFRVGGRRGAEEAEAHLDRALALDPSFAQAYVKKAEFQQWRRQAGYGNPDPRPAIVAAARLVKSVPEREQLLIESLEALIVHQRRDEAVRHLESLLSTYPTFAQEAGVPSLMLEVLMRQGRWEEMIRFGQAQLASPSLPEYQAAMVSSLLAEAYRHKGEFGPAIENAHRAVDLWPSRETPEWLRQKDTLGRINLDGGQRDAAVAEFRAIAVAPAADVDSVTHAAWGLYMAGEPAEARFLVERALSEDEGYGNAYHLLGWLQMAEGDYSRAAENLERAYERTPPQYGSTHHGQLGGDLAALYYAGVAWQKAGETARAKATLERVVDHCRTLERHFGDEPGAAARWQAANFLARAETRLGGVVSEPPRLPDDDTTYFVQSARLDALRGRNDVALRRLAQGLALGFRERRHILDDPDFESLRREPEFRRLVVEPLTRVASASSAH